MQASGFSVGAMIKARYTMREYFSTLKLSHTSNHNYLG
jgi:hypothetical protein